jgi:hypothetical protein
MQLRNWKFLVEREGGHWQIVTFRAPTRVAAMAAVCEMNPGRGVERYTQQLATELRATSAERRWAGTRYEIGSEFDPETWSEGDIIIDRRGHRTLVTGPLADSGYLPLQHIAPGEKYHGGELSLHVSALTNTYGYRREENVVPESVPTSFEGTAANDPTYDSPADVRGMVEGA